ncbi:hypothetical protein HPB48_001860 [Haemaphysalis longicornis]|uniref:Uncharacterized protein n=1 Tax=Haemaphysalis longicornis TaxID=44386 RepID=A0A9J6G4X6_HAELO|nr:hypothetical protein HPB48_001860 [Haemaphysalis longicornis]
MGSEYVPSAWYSALRDKPFPTLYGENRTPVTADVLEAGLILAFCIIIFAFLLLIPGVRGGKVRRLLVRDPDSCIYDKSAARCGSNLVNTAKLAEAE